MPIGYHPQKEVIMKTRIIFIFLVLSSFWLRAQTATAPAAGNGTPENPYEIASLDNLFWIAAHDSIVTDPDQVSRWASHYIQTADIDASATQNWFEGKGWTPIGTSYSVKAFRGTYNGQGHSITALYINRPDESDMGLFGCIRFPETGVFNLGLLNVNIKGSASVGALAGQNREKSLIDKCYSSGLVQGVNHVGGLVGVNSGDSSIVSLSSSTAEVIAVEHSAGGLVGRNATSSMVFRSHSSGNVTGESRVGGLVGHNIYDAEIRWSYSTGNVNGNDFTGGLVGSQNNHSLVIHSFGSGNVSGTGNYSGGIAGYNGSSSQITYSAGHGNVYGNKYVGGVTGYNFSGSAIEKSFASGNVNGNELVGGLVGWNYNISTLSESYFAGSVSGENKVGGLAGENNKAAILHSYSFGSVSGNSLSGGLTGYIVLGDGFEDTQNYWDMETSGQNLSEMGEGRTTQEMTYPYASNTFENWNFEHTWEEDEGYAINNGYPFLLWEIIPPPPAAAIDPIPGHEITEVPVNTPIGWTYLSDEGFSDPVGFILFMWTEGMEHEPFQMEIEGGVGEHLFPEPPLSLEHDKTYHWQVLPYTIFREEQILAEYCPVWFFTTEAPIGLAEIFSQHSTQLYGNFPNPFYRETTISFTVGNPGKVKIETFNLFGQKVTTLSEGFYEAGKHEIKWNGTNTSGLKIKPGLYFIRMTARGYNKTLKIQLLE